MPYAPAMLACRIDPLRRVVLLAVLTLALVGTGFAHRISLGEAQRLAFIAATGALAADICADTTSGAAHRGPDCLACQVAGGADLPPPIGSLLLARLGPNARNMWTEPRVRAVKRLDPAHPSQGPPVA